MQLYKHSPLARVTPVASLLILASCVLLLSFQANTPRSNKQVWSEWRQSGTRLDFLAWYNDLPLALPGSGNDKKKIVVASRN